MQIVIDIPEEKYNKLVMEEDHIRACGSYYPVMILDGIPLPKGHGRLIDADALVYKQTHHGNYYTQFELIDRNDLSNAPTIIEADKTESEE